MMGRLSRNVSLLLLTFFLSFVINNENVEGVAVMSVDLGSEWVKIGIVSPGVPMEIVLNKESKRKTPVAISFRDGERLIGEDALNVAVRFPPNAYIYFLDLLGKKLDNPIVRLFQSRFPYYNLVEDPERGTVVFKHDSDTYYSPEELLGMLISKCRDYAVDFARQPVNEAVITVPPFFNQAERRAVQNAAELAGIKVLQLMNSNTAGALNYGIFRRKDFNETAQNILLFDMGASSTVATVVSYQVAKEKGKTETNPQLSVLGVGYHRTLGGLEMQIRLRNYLAKAFNDMKKTKTDIFTNPRAMAKLFKEAGRVKNVLSANNDHNAQVEGLLDEMDFRFPVNREIFEKICEELFEKVKIPVKQALDAAALTMDSIDQVLLIGAGTRVPKVQEKLVAYVGRELGKSLNTDEAAAMGAVYKGADLSTGFKVKKFITKDAVLFPILVDFEREIEREDNTRTIKIIRRTLFSHMNPFPQKKILTFNKHVSDFSFYVSYGELSFLPVEEIGVFETINITKIDLVGVGSAIEKHGEGAEAKGVKAHFTMDESGLFSLSLVESVFEKNSTEGEGEDTLSKLGSAFSSLFSGSKDEAKPADGEAEEGKEKADDTSEERTTEKPLNESEKTDGSESQKGEDKLNSTAEVKKPKSVIVKETLQLTAHMLDVIPLDGEKFKLSADKLSKLNEKDRLRNLREKARNALEGFVLELQDKIHSSEYEHAITEEEKEKIGTTCSEISDWLYEDGASADREIYEEKFKSLKLMTKDLADRVREHKERPDALDALEKMLNISLGFLESSKGLPEDQQFFTDVEITTLEKLVKETLDWREKKFKEQAETPLTQTPILTIRSIAEKIDALDREVKYMVNKARVNKLKQQQKDRDAAIEKERLEREKNESTKGKDEPAVANEIPDEEKVKEGSEPEGEEVKPTETEDKPHTEL